MALNSRIFRTSQDNNNNNNYLVPRRSKDHQDISPDRTRVWSEPPRPKPSLNRKVPVVYYLCRNGQLDHPHFIEVTLSSHDGLYLKDVIKRLNDLRGKAMASLYSWSSKRSYKNGFVWHDLSEDDFIFPVQAQDYVLKGSEVLDTCQISNPRSLLETTSFRDPRSLNSKPNSDKNGDDFPEVNRRRNQSWSSIDLSEYKVYKATESNTESTRRLAADASTQTDERRRRRKPVKEEEIEIEVTELNRDEISPPPLDSSPETLESLIKSDGRLILRSENNDDRNSTVEILSSGRMKASAVLMQLISCGTMSFKECGPGPVSGSRPVLLSGRSGCMVRGDTGDHRSGVRVEKELKSFGGVKLEEKEYFSGSLIETKKELVPALKRSSSYNADRSSRMGPKTTEKDEEEAVPAKCIPRKSKSTAAPPRISGGY